MCVAGDWFLGGTVCFFFFVVVVGIVRLVGVCFGFWVLVGLG